MIRWHDMTCTCMVPFPSIYPVSICNEAALLPTLAGTATATRVTFNHTVKREIGDATLTAGPLVLGHAHGASREPHRPPAWAGSHAHAVSMTCRGGRVQFDNYHTGAYTNVLRVQCLYACNLETADAHLYALFSPSPCQWPAPDLISWPPQNEVAGVRTTTWGKICK